MKDKTVIDQCRNGDMKNFRNLVDEASPFAFSVAFRMTGDETTAADIVQETMITVWRSIKNLRSAESFNSWFYRILMNKCYDELRRRKRSPEIAPDEKLWERLSGKTPDQDPVELNNSEIAAIILTLTEGLSPRQKAVFVLSELEEMPAEEIEAVTGMSRTRIKANLYYARKRIGELLKKYM